MPDTNDQALLSLVVKCYDEAYTARRDQISIESPFPGKLSSFDYPWPVYQEFYEGKHWKRMGNMPGWKSRPQDNQCFQICESMTTFITDNRAKAQFIPMEVDDALLSDKVQAAWNMWANTQSYDTKMELCVLDSRKFGLGWLHLRYDSDIKKQVLEVVHPESVMVDPDTTADTYLSGQEPSYLIYEYVAQVGDLKDSFPKADWARFQKDWMPQMSKLDRIKRFFGIGNTQADNPAVSVPVYELWIRDPETVEWDTSVASIDISVKKKKYPRGRRIIVAGNIVLHDGENPYKHGQFPFTPILAYPESGKFYCAGDIQNILNMQVMYNRMMQILFDGTVKSGGGIVMVNPRYGVTADMVTNDVIQIIETSDVNQSMRMERFPAPSRHVFDFMGELRRGIADTAGVHDISRGVYTPGNKTAQEIAALTESDKTRVRKASRWLAWVNERIARQWVHNCAQWYDWSYFVRISGEDGTDMTYTVGGDDLRKPKYDKKGQFDGLSDEVLDFDILIADSSTLPTYFQDRKQMAMQLFQMQVIDQEALLEALEFPGWRAIQQRMNAKAQAAPPAQPEQVTPAEPTHQMPDGSMMPDAAMDEDSMPVTEQQLAQIAALMGEV